MITEIRVGNLLEFEAQTLVNTVNCVGVMGKGIALQFKGRFPEMYADYVRRCKAGQVRMGEPYLYKSLFDPWVLNFPTKQDWRSVSRLSDIVDGLEYLAQHYREWGVESLAVPPLGCGNGGLEWRIVGPTLYRHLDRLEIPVYLYAPLDVPDDQRTVAYLSEASQEPSIAMLQAIGGGEHLPVGWVALVEILERIEREPYRWPVGRIAFQKLAYFATVSGIPTDLDFERGSYGPFAPGLKRAISKLVNNGLIVENLLGRMIAVEVGPTYSDARQAYDQVLLPMEDAIEKVAELFLRMNTRQAEMAATVHFVASESHEKSETQVLAAVMTWKHDRSPKWTEEEVADTIRNLAAMGWIHVRPDLELKLPSVINADI